MCADAAGTAVAPFLPMLCLPRPLVWLLSALVFTLVVASAHGEDAVTLRPTAVSVGPVIRLSAVANLEGPGAAELGVVPVRTNAAAGPQAVTLDEVRAALAEAGANLGRLRVHGVASCSVDVRAAPAAPAAPLPPARVDDTPPVAAELSPSTEDPLSDRLRHRLAGWLGLPAEEHASLRVTTDPADAALLHRSAADARFRVEPLGRPRLGRVSVRIEERGPLGDLQLHTVSVTAEREVEAVVVTGPIRRGDTFSAANVAVEAVTLGREPAGAAEPMATLDGVLGAEAAVTLLPGTRLVPGHLARPALVKRGGQVTVRVAAGAVELVTEGVTEADAALGEPVTVRLGRDRGQRARTVEAVVSGVNEVRVDQL